MLAMMAQLDSSRNHLQDLIEDNEGENNEMSFAIQDLSRAGAMNDVPYEYKQPAPTMQRRPSMKDLIIEQTMLEHAIQTQEAPRRRMQQATSLKDLLGEQAVVHQASSMTQRRSSMKDLSTAGQGTMQNARMQQRASLADLRANTRQSTTMHNPRMQRRPSLKDLMADSEQGTMMHNSRMQRRPSLKDLMTDAEQGTTMHNPRMQRRPSLKDLMMEQAMVEQAIQSRQRVRMNTITTNNNKLASQSALCLSGLGLQEEHRPAGWLGSNINNRSFNDLSNNNRGSRRIDPSHQSRTSSNNGGGPSINISANTTWGESQQSANAGWDESQSVRSKREKARHSERRLRSEMQKSRSNPSMPDADDY
jgi:hypothetical protein